MDFLTEAFDKPAYELTYEEKFVGMDYIWYFQDGSQEYKLHFEKQVGLGKKVFRVILGQRTPGTKAYKKVIAKFRDPFRVVATILEATNKFIEAQSGKAYGLAYGLPIAAFGAYKTTISKVIQRKLMTKVDLTDISFQPPKAEEDGLYYIYMTIKPHTIKQTFDGKWFDQAVVDAAKIQAPTVSTSKGGSVVASTNPSASNTSATPVVSQAQKPGANADFYMACAKMASAKEFQELKDKFGVGQDFSYRKFGGEAFKKGSQFKWFPGWDTVEAEILSTIPSVEEKGLFKAYVVRQFYYQEPTLSNFLSMKDTIKELNRPSTASAYTEVIQPIVLEMANEMVKQTITYIKNVDKSVEVKELAEGVKKEYADLAAFDHAFGPRFFLAKMRDEYEKETDTFMKLKIYGFVRYYDPMSNLIYRNVNLYIDYAGVQPSNFAQSFNNNIDAYAYTVMLRPDNALATYLKGMSESDILKIYGIIIEINDPSLIKSVILSFLASSIEPKEYNKKIDAYVKGGGTMKDLSELMKGEPTNSQALAVYAEYQTYIYRDSMNKEAKQVLLSECSKLLKDSTALAPIPGKNIFTDLYTICTNDTRSTLKEYVPAAYLKFLKEDKGRAIKFMIARSDKYKMQSAKDFSDLVDWPEVGKIIFKEDLTGFGNDFFEALRYLNEYTYGPLPIDQQRLVASEFDVTGSYNDFGAFKDLLRKNYIGKEVYNERFKDYLVSQEAAKGNAYYVFGFVDDENLDSNNRLGALNMSIKIPFETKKHSQDQIEKILYIGLGSYGLNPDFSINIASESHLSRFKKLVDLLDEHNGKFDREGFASAPYVKLMVAWVTKEEKLVKKIVSENPNLLAFVKVNIWDKGYSDSLTDYFHAMIDIFGEKEAVAMFAEAAATEEKSRGAKVTHDEWEKYRSNFSNALASLKEKSAKKFEEVYDSLPTPAKKLVAKKVIESSFIKLTHESIFGDTVPIKPMMSLTPERVKEILKYNRINIPAVRIVKEFDSVELNKRIAAAKTIDIPGLNVVEEPKTEEELKGMSFEYDFFNKGKHGDIGIKILKVFNVDIPIQTTGFEEFKTENPTTKIISPAFHGTGSVAASMILRKGFAVLKEGDSSVVGRMLGDGIYFSNVLDKVAQYASDGGYSRGIGNKGYIFEMDAALGVPGINYRAAGTGADDTDGYSVVSPEWCVFDGNRQLRIKKAYMIELVERSLVQSYGEKVNESVDKEINVLPINHFDAFLKEAKMGSTLKGAITYTFMDGNIPMLDGSMVDFEDFKVSDYKGLRVEISGMGPMVVFDSKDTLGYAVRSTRNFQDDKQELAKFLKLLKAAKK